MSKDVVRKDAKDYENFRAYLKSQDSYSVEAEREMPYRVRLNKKGE